MRKIINGKLYDTETARELGIWTSTWDHRDFHYVAERLYLKRTGEYFLHGTGGPASKYAVTVGQNSWSGGEKIIPLSVESARQWAEEHLDADDYAQIFGMPDEDDAGKVTLCVQIPADLSTIIRRQASDRGISLTAYVTEALAAAAKK